MSLTFERYYPWIFSVAAFLFVWLAEPPMPKSPSDLMAASISLGAIFAGFLATAQAILMAMPESGLLSQMRNSGYRPIFGRYFAQPVEVCLLVLLLIRLGFLDLNAPWLSCFWYAWIFVGIASLSCFWRVTHVMLVILGNV